MIALVAIVRGAWKQRRQYPIAYLRSMQRNMTNRLLLTSDSMHFCGKQRLGLILCMSAGEKPYVEFGAFGRCPKQHETTRKTFHIAP